MKEFLLNWTLQNGIQIVVVIILAFLSDTLTGVLFKKIRHTETGDFDEQDKKVQTLFSVFHSALKIFIYLIALLLILEILDINIKPILAAAGVLGIAIGFGSQRFVEDIISGLTIILNKQIRIGDVVKICEKTGYVEKITLNMVVLRDMEGSVHFIRNGKIDVVSNLTQDYSYYVADISVAYKENIENVIEVIKLVGENLRQNGKNKDEILEPIEVYGLDKFDNSAVIIKARIKTKPIKQWAVGREFNLLLKKEFDKLEIEIPFEQRTIHFANNNAEIEKTFPKN